MGAKNMNTHKKYQKDQDTIIICANILMLQIKYFSNLYKTFYNFIFNFILKSKLITYILLILMYDQAENLHKYKTSILSSVFWGYDNYIASQR